MSKNKGSFKSIFSLLLAGIFIFGTPEIGISGDAEAHGSEKAFNAGEMILHHIADANEFHVVGDFAIPLPVIIYNKDEKSWFTGISSSFKPHHGEGTVEVGGYKMEHSRVVPVNGTNIIDFSITKNVLSLIVLCIILVLIFTSVARSYKRRQGQAPKGMQNLLEPVILFVRDQIAIPSIGEHKYQKFMPYLLTLFFFIWFGNLLGLIPLFPGGANLTGNIAIPIVMAVFTFVITTINGNKHYWRHIFAMPGIPKPVLLLLTPLEIAGMFIKPIVLVIRLFANITAGHIVILVFISLIFIFGQSSGLAGGFTAIPAMFFAIFLNVLELLVGAIQAYVFTLLSAIYFGAAVASDHH